MWTEAEVFSRTLTVLTVLNLGLLGTGSVINNTSTDFLEQADLDSGGFGKVCLCLHRSHGLVILKKVYTGPKRTE